MAKTSNINVPIVRLILIAICPLLLAGCFLNTLQGNNSWWRHYAAREIMEGIDKAIGEEVNKESPQGYKTKPYSREAWNNYWNSRIYYRYDLGKTDYNKAYRGPSGPEFIAYILDSRRVGGLPELVIEERNHDRVPSAH